MSLSLSTPDAVLNDLKHADVDRRGAAIYRLVQQRTTVSGATIAVIRLVSDRNEDVSGWACEALESSVVPQAAELGDLIELLRDSKDGEIQYWTATMIGRLGAVGSSATAVLANCLLDSPCLAARERAAWALSEIGPSARSAINALKQIGPEDPPRLQRLAATAIQAVVNRAA